MNSEKLKVIAAGMGCEVDLVDSAGVWVYPATISDKTGGRATYRYNPLVNNNEMVAIMERLLSEGQLSFEKIEDEVWLTNERSQQFTGKTINEAVCNAAYEHFK